MAFYYVSLPFTYLPPTSPILFPFPILSSQLWATLNIYAQEDTVRIIQNGMCFVALST